MARPRLHARGVLTVLMLMLGCSVYDSALLPNSHVSDGPSLSASQASSGRGANSDPRDEPSEADANGDADGGAGTCGNGRVEADERCDTAIASGRPGACPTACKVTTCIATAKLVGAGCQRRCATTLVTESRDGDGCCPATADPSTDRDCGVCGDFMIAPGELCDPPERCPNRNTCHSEGCYAAVLQGDPDKCSSTCMRTAIVECKNGDGCCPAGCSRGTDDDCAIECGDGVLDERNGETCEPMSSIAPCATSCDDGDACTTDMLTGSSQNCNVSCVHFPVTSAANGDGCCPPGASAVTDSDCAPRCGNNVKEAGEECDGGMLCSADCRAVSMAKRQCLDATFDAMTDAACKACICDNCASDAVDCYASGDADRDRHCSTLVQCGRKADCTGDDCYCGRSPACISPSGPCRAEIEAGAGSTSPQTVEDRKNNTRYALVRAREYGDCQRKRCADQCRLPSGSRGR